MSERHMKMLEQKIDGEVLQWSPDAFYVCQWFLFSHSLKFTEKACSMLMAVDIHIHCTQFNKLWHCCNFLSDEKRRKEDPDQDRSSTKCSIDEWLSRREKKRAALSSGRYLMQDTAQNGDFERLDCFQNVFHSLRWVMGSILNDF